MRRRPFATLSGSCRPLPDLDGFGALTHPDLVPAPKIASETIRAFPSHLLRRHAGPQPADLLGRPTASRHAQGNPPRASLTLYKLTQRISYHDRLDLSMPFRRGQHGAKKERAGRRLPALKVVDPAVLKPRPYSYQNRHLHAFPDIFCRQDGLCGLAASRAWLQPTAARVGLAGLSRLVPAFFDPHTDVAELRRFGGLPFLGGEGESGANAEVNPDDLASILGT